MAGAVLLTALTSCGGGQKGPSPLVAQSERLALDLGSVAEDSPMFISAIDVDYADAVLTVGIDFADPSLRVADLSEALVQYTLAQYLKSHGGPNLDEIINTLSAEEGKLVIALTGCDSVSRNYDIPAARLKQLVRLKPIELNFTAVKDNVVALMAAECIAYKDEYKADDCTFEIAGGFAQYTLTFDRATAYASLNQASLTGRYVKKLKEQYENYGSCRPMIEQLLKSLQIDGYRFIYNNNAGGKDLSAGIPWRLLNE